MAVVSWRTDFARQSPATKTPGQTVRQSRPRRRSRPVVRDEPAENFGIRGARPMETKSPDTGSTALAALLDLDTGELVPADRAYLRIEHELHIWPCRAAPRRALLVAGSCRAGG